MYLRIPKSSLLIVKEIVSNLKKLLRQESNSKNVLSLQSLIHIQKKYFSTRSDLADQLGYHTRTMELWLKSYKEQGVKLMIKTNKKPYS